MSYKYRVTYTYGSNNYQSSINTNTDNELIIYQLIAEMGASNINIISIVPI